MLLETQVSVRRERNSEHPYMITWQSEYLSPDKNLPGQNATQHISLIPTDGQVIKRGFLLTAFDSFVVIKEIWSTKQR